MSYDKTTLIIEARKIDLALPVNLESISRLNTSRQHGVPVASFNASL